MKPLTQQWHETNKAHGEQYLPWLEAKAEEMRLRIMALEGENRRLAGELSDSNSSRPPSRFKRR